MRNDQKLQEHLEVNRRGFQQMFNSIEKDLTPDFKGEDWFKLYEMAVYGDSISAQMLMDLWSQKVNPYLKPEFRVDSIFEGEI